MQPLLPRGIDVQPRRHVRDDRLSAFVADSKRKRMSERDPATRTHVDRAIGPTVPKATLRWMAPGRHVRRLAVDDRALVGSAPGAQVLLDHETVSRVHAEIVTRSTGVWVRDLGSRNGTFVDDLRVECARLADGAMLRFGGATVGVSLRDEPMDVTGLPQLGPLYGESPAMQALFGRIARIAPTESTVLITGETGTGKELAARAIHEASARASGPFVVVDCAALNDDLIEADLFGYARGAYTGADREHAGALEAANGGTVFLDEIGELSIAAQPKLLRVLESRMVRRIGETGYREIDVRFVAATHRDLPALVGLGGFREDLYFRLAVVVLEMPPLRARPEDLPGLVRCFAGDRAPALLRTPRFLEELGARPWLGNVRELRNHVERVLAVGHDAAPMVAPPPPELSVDLDATYKDNRDRVLDALERRYLAGLMERHGRNLSEIARRSGLDRTWVHRLVRKHGL